MRTTGTEMGPRTPSEESMAPPAVPVPLVGSGVIPSLRWPLISTGRYPPRAECADSPAGPGSALFRGRGTGPPRQVSAPSALHSWTDAAEPVA